MTRSKWKGPYLSKNEKMVEYISRNSEITPNFLGLTFKIHNGQNYFEVKVSSDMFGHKFGEFAFTRKKFVFKKKKLKKVKTYGSKS